MTPDSPDTDRNGPSELNQEVRELPLKHLSVRQLIALDACTRCGECLTWCPVYDQDAKEAIVPRRKVIDFLNIARSQHGLLARVLKQDTFSPTLRRWLGRIMGYRQIGTAEIEAFVNNLYECSTCGQCEVVCPAHIETVSLWEELRRIMVEAGYGPLDAQKGLVKSVKSFDNPWQQPRAGRTKWARRAIKDGLLRSMPREIRKTGGKVLLFFGCTAAYDVNVKQVAINSINILEALGIDYGILGSEEKCCASVLLRMGDPEHKRVFQENIDIFNSLGIETLISSCSGCFKTILQDYPKVAPLHFEVLHTVEFLARLLRDGKLRFTHRVERTVTYHDPCHLGRATGGFDAPRMIMEAIPGLKLVEMPRNREYSRCCGAGGGLKAGYPDIQNRMAQRRIREAEETCAAQLVSCCPFCFQGLNIGITAMGSQLVMTDISSLVAEALLGYDVFAQAGVAGAATKNPPDTTISAPVQTAVSEAAVTPAMASPAPEGNADKAPPADKRAEKEVARAAKRAARRAGAIAVPQSLADPIKVSEEDSGSPSSPAQPDDAQAPDPTEKERRRAEKRAARRKTADGGTPAEPLAAPWGQAETVPAMPPPALGGSGPAAPQARDDDGKLDREAKRAARRAEREKEKAERRAARTRV